MDRFTLSFKISPLVPDADLHRVVDVVIAFIQRSGVKHLVGPSETTLEGSWDTLMPIVKKSIELCYQEGAQRVGFYLMGDSRVGGIGIDEKISQYR